MGPLHPFWPKSNEARRGQGSQPPTFNARWVPNHKWAHLSQIWPPIPPVPQMAKRTPGPKLATFSPGLCKPPEATNSSPESFLLHSGERLLFTNVLRSMDSGMVHIWYNIPLCTNFAQQSNGDGSRTKLGHFKTSPQIQNPVKRKPFQPFCLAIHGDYPKTIQGPQSPGATGVGFYFLSGFFQGQFQEVIKH
ncbi:hypothetical protein O181_010234 [Austropuccinia psidii MF-1]|uniref:Uncharacterized protein n=1 Tax=Austropuccinia psidii MF-1 TaxID=1389203 RepID=A0A9Q3BQN1_9BASI|nr:hypothetical protein [Austropuccinia psidii MF-1]